MPGKRMVKAKVRSDASNEARRKVPEVLGERTSALTRTELIGVGSFLSYRASVQSGQSHSAS